ncbi:MAG: arginase family protein, partial [Planctomycetota bacterium]
MILDRKVSLIGAPLDLGGAQRGASLGPTAVRLAGLAQRVQALGLEFEDLGDVPVPEPASTEPADPSARFLDEIATHCA